jgi:protein-S-isoprenylcysteine O-methyltransferase Ste14
MKALENKIPPPFVASIFGILIWWLAGLVPEWEIDSLLKILLVSLLLALGAFFSLSGILNFRRVKTTANPLSPHKASTLVSTGIYRITRNPMYVGLAFVLSGWGFYLNSPASLLGVVGYILYIHYLQVIPEERALLKLFGEEYDEYRSRVNRWL